MERLLQPNDSRGFSEEHIGFIEASENQILLFSSVERQKK